MATIYENVAYLSQEIGPRPAGTEEEQKAALYITEEIQKESGLPAIIEDFQCSPDFEIPKTICCIVAILTMLLSIFAPVLNLILVVLAGIAAVLFAAEAFDMPILSRFFVRGMSQNVVARYEPGYADDKKAGRKRKVIFIARYDSGKVSRETTSPLFHLLPLIRWIELFGIVANFVVLLLRAIINPMGVALIVFNILSIITMAICALPIIGMIFHQISSYNEGANCNASGVAVLMELANRIGKARVPASELSGRISPVVVHGAEAAEREGLVPEGAEIVYDVEETPMPDVAPGSPEERLLAAKAAVAALSGRPVSQTINISFEREEETPTTAAEAEVETVVDEATFEDAAVAGGEEIVAESLETAAASEAAVETIGEVETVSRADVAAVTGTVDQASSTQVLSAGLASRSRRIQPLQYPAPQPTSRPQSDSGGVPDWFARAQKNAKRVSEKPSQAQRSRYAQAYDNAQATMAALREAEGPEISETERKLQAIRDSLSAPTHPQSSVMTIGEAEALNAEVEPMEAAIAEAAAVEAQPAFAGAPAATETVDAVIDATPEEVKVAEAVASAAEPVVAEAEAVEVKPAAVEMKAETVKASPAKTGGLDALFGAPEPPRRETVRSSVEATPIMEQTRAFVPVKVDLDELRSLDVETAEASVKTTDASTSAQLERASAEVRVDPSRSAPVEVVAEAADETVKTGQSPEVSAQLEAMRAAIPSIKIESAGAEAVEVEESKSHLSEELPAISMESAEGDEGLRQRAPLAEAPQTPTGRMRQLQASLPHLGVTGTDLLAEAESPKETQRDSLRSAVPSLSGVLNDQAQARETIENISVSQASSFAASSATGAFEPIGDELVEDIAPEERYVDDVDDSAYAETMTETGAFSGPGYVDMPESRVKRLFGRFRRNKRDRDEEPSSAQEWLDVDEEFDARKVGAERGSWESFRTDDDFDDEAVESETVIEDVETEESDEARPSNRRSARRSQTRRSTHPRPRTSSRTQRRSSESRRWHGGAFSGEERERLGRVSTASEDTAQETVNTLEEVTTGKSGEIFRFRHPEIDVEVWFVALGAELANNAGMNAFLADHRSELRGATIIELEGIGAGELAIVEREGMYLSRESSTRIERMVRKAASAVGVHVDKANMEWRSSATSYALRHGSQAIQLIGELNGKPAYFGEEGDLVETVDEEMLERNADLLMELLKDV